MNRIPPKLVFCLVLCGFWLRPGELWAEYLPFGIERDGIVSDSFTSGAMSPSTRPADQPSPKPQFENDLNLPFEAAQPGNSGGGMSSSSSQGPTGPSLAAVIADYTRFCPHVIKRLMIESAARPPTPYLLGVFRPPRSLDAV